MREILRLGLVIIGFITIWILPMMDELSVTLLVQGLGLLVLACLIGQDRP